MQKSTWILLLFAILNAHAFAEENGFVPLYNGKDLNDWHAHNGKISSWKANGELISCIEAGGGWLSTNKEYADYILKVDWRIEKDGNSGIGLRFTEGDPAHEGMEIQILDDDAPKHKNLVPAQYTGAIYYQVKPLARAAKPLGEWNSYEITCKGPLVVVKLNGVEVCRANMDEEKTGAGGHKPLSERPRKGYIGLQSHDVSHVDFKNLWIKEL